MRFQHTTLGWPPTGWMLGTGTLLQICAVDQAFTLAGGLFTMLAAKSVYRYVLEARFEDPYLDLCWPGGSLKLPLLSLTGMSLNRGCIILQSPGPTQHLIRWHNDNELAQLASEIGKRFRAARAAQEAARQQLAPEVQEGPPREAVQRARPRHRNAQTAPRPQPETASRPRSASSSRGNVEDWFFD